jgi:hypothetical protein
MAGPTFRTFSLVPRGGPGLACDESGLALGPIALSRKLRDPSRGIQYRLLTLDEMKQILRIAYGSVHSAVVERRCRGIARATQLMNIGSDALAQIHAVLIGFPEIEPEAMAKLAVAAALRKYNPDWEDEPRIPAGEPGAGEWTNGDDEDDANDTQTEISRDECLERCSALALPTRDYGTSFFRCVLACRSNGNSGFPEWDRFFR